MALTYNDNRCFKITKPQFRHREKESHRYLPATVSRPSGEMWTNTKTDTQSFTEKTGTPTKEIDKKATQSVSLSTRDTEYADAACSTTKTYNFVVSLATTTRYANKEEKEFDELYGNKDDDSSAFFREVEESVMEARRKKRRLQIMGM